MQVKMEEISPIKENILQYLDYKGISKAEFCRKTGFSYENFKGRSLKSDIGGSTIGKITTIFRDLNPDWLLTGKGEMLRDHAALSPYLAQKGAPYYAVDFIAGFDLVFNDQTTTPDNYIYVPQYKNADCWVDVTGDSMAPLIANGDIVALKRVGDWKNNLLGGEIYAIVTNQWRTIKKVRMVKGDDTKLLLVPLNADYDTIEISKKSVVAVFQVLGAIKKIG